MAMMRLDILFSSTIVGSKIQGPRRGGRAVIEKADLAVSVMQSFQTITSAVRQGMIVKGRTVIVSGAGLQKT
jgi:hypothetical protein